jgi:4-hydroxybenzoyl-CoA reductase subunit beta
MLPLPPFSLHAPASIDEALALLARHGPDAALIAGGTDLLPNMKQGLTAPRHVVSLANVGALRGVTREGDTLRIGAMTTLETIAASPMVREHARALAEAARAVAGPHHRRMGTLGGNLCLDTRCRYYNQTYFWREALGHCLKKDGTVCHVVAGGQRCVAAASNDTAPAAIALDGEIAIVGPNGARTTPVRGFYTADGVKNTRLEPGEIVTSLSVPIVPGRTSAYEKLRRRGAIDFPLLGVAVRADVDAGVVRAFELVVSALAAKPRPVGKAAALALGKRLADVPFDAVGETARKECNPLPNVDGDVLWRREMIPVLVKRAAARLA